MPVLYCDTERGSLSIRSRIKNGSVLLRKTPNLTALDKVIWDFLRAKKKPDLFVIDTLTTLATTVRLDVVIDPKNIEEGMSLWDMRGRLTASQRDWGEMGDLIIRALRMIRDNEDCIPSVFICHEGDREDPQTDLKKDGPDLNRMLLRDVYGQSDVVFRIYLTDKALKDKEGNIHSAGSRVLRIAANPTSMAKMRFPDDMDEPDSPIIFDPTWEKIVSMYGGTCPERILIYGPAGVGKTRLIGTAADYYAKIAPKASPSFPRLLVPVAVPSNLESKPNAV